ncbi:hypothetical protein BC829DRAFT_381552 [Chytridium lagenaria]|nr:hypothetical protein BC829DRAFT_381552 [Chytridium lagenaria]
MVKNADVCEQLGAFMTTLKAKNPRKTSCDVCRSLKRKCNGTFRMCKKRRNFSDNSEEPQPPAVVPPLRQPPPVQPYPTYTILKFDTPPLEPVSASFVRQSLDPLVSFLDNMNVTFALSSNAISSALPSPLATKPDLYDMPPDLVALYYASQQYDVVDQTVIHKYLSGKTGTMHIEIVNTQLDTSGSSMFFRYSMCAMASMLSNPPAPHIITKTYYKMARKLLPSAMDNPTIESLQAILGLYSCGIALGDCTSTKWLLQVTLRMATYLKLDKEPSANTLPLKADMTSGDIEKRRQCWEACYFLDRMASVYYGETSFFMGNPSRPYSDSSRYTSRGNLIELTDVAFQIGNAVRLPLQGFDDLQARLPELRLVEALLLEWLEGQPEIVRLNFESGLEVLLRDGFGNSCGGSLKDEQSMAETLLSKFLFHTCWCLLHRPRLHLKVDDSGAADADIVRQTVLRSMGLVERSSKVIHNMVEQIMAKSGVRLRYLHPSVGFSVLTSFYGFLDLILRPETTEASRMEFLGMMRTNFALLNKFNDVWESFQTWMPILRLDLTSLHLRLCRSDYTP